MSAIRRIGVGSLLSDAAVHGGLVFVAGQAADDSSVGVREQTRQTLGRIDEVLKEAGSDKTRLLSATVWLADMADFEAMNAVWEAWLPKGAAPARATVQAALFDPQTLVEIMVIAAL